MEGKAIYLDNGEEYTAAFNSKKSGEAITKARRGYIKVAKLQAEALPSCAACRRDEIRARRETKGAAELMRYKDVLDAAYYHQRAMRALIELCSPNDLEEDVAGYELLTRGNFVTLLDCIMQPLDAALKTFEAEAGHE